VYPEYKQRNIGIYGTDEEREAFKTFKESQVSWYDAKMETVNACETANELEMITVQIDND
jgi:hypothetical protein